MRENNNRPIQSSAWFAKPGPAHVVQFYSSGTGLIRNLLQYVSSALKADEVCIVIAAAARIKKLDKQLELSVDIGQARREGRYTTMDAAKALSEFMVDGSVNEERFYASIGTVVDGAVRSGKPVRLYGEMVALLWREGNKEAVIGLEKLWNDLAIYYPFSLYCAYPELHFVMDPEVQGTIQQCHTPLQYGLAGSSA